LRWGLSVQIYITKDNFVSSGVPVVRGNNLNNFIFYDNDFVFLTKEKADSLSSSNCYAEDILITHRGTLGQVGFIPRDSKYNCYVISQSGMKLTVNKERVDPRYIFLFLKSKIGQYFLLRNTSQTGVPAISQPTASLKNIPIFFPSDIKEQKEIVEIIWNIQSKIDNLRRQNETLETIAQTLFKHWFIDFEFPNDEGKPYKSSGGAMVASELRDIPEGWRVGKLGDITRVINGRAYKQTEFREEGTPIVRIQNLTGEGKTVYSDLSLDKDKYIESGDLIYAWSATFGPYIWRGAKSIYHYHIWKLNCYYEWFKYYLFIHLKRVSETVKNQGTGSIFTHITKDLMENQELLVPDDKTMLKWDSCITPLFDKIMSNYQQIQTLTKTRDTLLPKLMSGQIRVKD